MDDGNPIITLQDISFGYPSQRLVLDKLNLSVYKGERLGLLGANGSGKTTLFHIIMGLLKPLEGSIEIFGCPVVKEKDFKFVRTKIGLLFQDADDQLFSPTVLEDVAFGPLNLGKSKAEAREVAQKTLSSLGLTGFENRITYKLSGGEKRLVSLATILAMEPDVLLLDEPSTGLDEPTEKRLVDILKSLDVSYILVSHNMDFLLEITNRVGWLVDGKFTVDEESVPHAHVHLHGHGKYVHNHALAQKQPVNWNDRKLNPDDDRSPENSELNQTTPIEETTATYKGIKMDAIEKAKIRLENWITHNEHHHEDYDEFLKGLEASGKSESAKHIREMIALTERSTDCLKKALKALD